MQTNPNVITCPECEEPYAVALETGMRFCPSCRHEWDPAAVVEHPAAGKLVGTPHPDFEFVDASSRPTAGRQAGEPIRDEADFIAEVDALEPYSTMVAVEHDDGGSGNWRTDHFAYVTDEPHTAREAEIAALDHYMHDVGSGVRGAYVVPIVPPAAPSTVDEIDEDAAAELEAFTADQDAQAAAYLEALTGTMVTLEGGQRATILGFDDDDRIRVQLADGSTALVEFNDVIHADNGPPAGAIVEVEIDDVTAELLGDAVLTMACLAVEAGLASLIGDGDEYELVEPPSGWIPDDADAIPLMEQAAAVAVAMLVKTFGLPRDMIAVAVDKVRPATRKGDVTEEA